MTTVINRPREVAIPAASLNAVQRALMNELGSDNAARVLRRAGNAAGDAMYSLVEPHADDLGKVAFWERLSEILAARGWGQLSHGDPHPGVGALTTSDWAEADPNRGAARPCCNFTTGMLANLLGRIADADIGVLEVECRSRGDLRCRFLFGARPALDRVHTAVASGTDADSALAELS